MTRSKEWHEARRDHVGASEVATLSGINPWGSPYEVWATKKGIIPPFEGNDATRLGQDMEAAILDVAERDLGPLVRDVVVEHDDKRLRCTLDGATREEGVPVEVKTAGLLGGNTDAWGDEGDVLFADQIPASYYVQVQTQLLLTRQDFAWLYALVARRGICKYKVPANRDTQQSIVQLVDAWWEEHMVNNVAPSMLNASKQTLSMIPRQQGATCSLPDSAAILLDDIERGKMQRKQAEADIKAAEVSLIELLDDNEVGTLSDGRSVTFKETTRKGYTRDVAASTFRTLRVKQARKVK